jgi:hypothetical protein
MQSKAPRIFLATLAILCLLAIAWVWLTLNSSYSEGDRAGYVQKLSKKGWLCKTWEGEIAMVTMPGAIPEKFEFTVRDDAVAEKINTLAGKRVVLYYQCADAFGQPGAVAGAALKRGFLPAGLVRLRLLEQGFGVAFQFVQIALQGFLAAFLFGGLFP